MINFDNGPSRQKALKAVLLSLFFICVVYLYPAGGYAAEDQAGLWQAARTENNVVLMRHALAPGVGDPPTFTIDKCRTQRNLSTDGRRQARAIGNRFRANGIHQAKVFSSQWCRCLETAELLNLGPVEELTVLNSFFNNYERRDSQTAELLDWIARQSLKQPTVLVTHQVNITALTQIYPDSGEMIVVKRSESGILSVLGTIETD